MTALLKISLHSVSLALLLVLTMCKAADSNQTQENAVDKIVKERLGLETTFENSANGTYRLYKQTGGGHAARSYKYLVVRLSDQTVVSEGQYRMGYVKWKDDATLELVTSNGPADREPEKKFINLNINSN
jgi:hypothetical protein